MGGVEPGPILTAWLGRTVCREPIGGGYSGSSVERIHLDDGTTLVVKYLNPATDWQMRATSDDGREARLSSMACSIGWVRLSLMPLAPRRPTARGR